MKIFKIPNQKGLALSSSKGFTLIELLVAIAIIGLLAGVIMINIKSARQKGRCGKRRADIVSLQAPLEAYYDAQVPKSYPITGSWWGTCSGAGSHDVTGANGYIPNLAPTYIRRLPSDPASSIDRCYYYRSDNGQNYALLSHMPQTDDCSLNDPKDPLYAPGCPTWAWEVRSGGDQGCGSGGW